ncbi:MAG: aminotransferase class V-fold PLP-dependent enzyme [Thermomicrobiales bacterium]|nr:aminotransferase class V-fold PLP-dependent enzyme [Thermomicrobiales bacterium]
MTASIYEKLDIRPVINAAATLTKLGGSLMPQPVVEAMAAAAGQYTDLFELQRKVGERIAELTKNEAAFVTSGAAGGIAMSVASCIAGTDPDLQQDFPYLDRATKREVIVYKAQRNGYDYAARQTGARLIEISPDGDDLEMSITEKTACVLYFAGAHFAEGALPLDEVIAISHTLGAPVIVDAAAQIPPISNLWHFTTELGADAAIFSGGKGLRGPQSSGIVVGKKAIIDGIRPNSAPNQSVGRPMKVGKEEMAGLLAALEWSLAQDEPATLAQYEEIVRYWIAEMADIPGITVERSYPSEAGQPHSRAMVWVGPDARLTRDAAVDALWDLDPRIAVNAVDDDGIALNPQTLESGEEEVVLASVRQVFMPTG